MILEISSATSYVIAVLVPALDALIPVLPSEGAVIALGAVTAGSTDPRIALLVGLAAFGAIRHASSAPQPRAPESCGPATRSSSAGSAASCSKTGRGSACCSRSAWLLGSAYSSRQDAAPGDATGAGTRKDARTAQKPPPSFCRLQVTSGKVSVRRVPSPGSLLAASLPPCARARSGAIARPMPLPQVRPAGALIPNSTSG